MLSNAVLILVTVILAILVTLLVLLAQTVTRRVKASFTTVLVSLLLWQLNIFVADHTQTHLMALNHLVFLWPTIAAAGFLVFLVLLRQNSHQGISKASKKLIAFYTTMIFAFLLQVAAVGSGQIFEQVYYVSATGEYVFIRGFFYPIYLVGLITIILGVIIQLTISFMLSKHDSQQRAAFKTVTITVIVATLCGMLTNVVLPLFIDSQRYISLGLLAVNVFAIGLALSIAKYQFLNIRAYVFRSLVYLITILVMMLGYVGAAVIISNYILRDALNLNTIVTLSLITLVVAAFFQPLTRYFNSLTSQIFFREYYDPQNVLDQLGKLLVRTVDLESIKIQSTEILESALKPTSLKYLLFTNRHKGEPLILKQLARRELNIVTTPELQNEGHAALAAALKKEDVGVVIRLRTKHEDLGFMLLGFRRSGASYSAADKRFLGLVADQLSLGLQNALRFQEIESFNATLQQRIEEATKRLRQTNAKLRMLDQTKDDFISMASHQLRTPLTSVKGYVSMVLEGDAGKLTRLQRKLLNQAFISSQRMVYLISDLLNVSRLRTGKFIIEPIPTNLAKVIKDEVDQLQETARGRNLQLTFDKPDHFPALMLDETKMRQVIMNFIDNAIYYTPSGGHITVNLADKPGSIEFTVVDDGIGVPKPERHRLFTKFFRAHNAKRARPDGTGLGLFMAKKVVVAQGGAIIFQSHENKGSTFGFSFAKGKVQNANGLVEV